MNPAPNVMLLTTCLPDQPGSMRRYADMVEQGLRASAPDGEITRVDLAPSSAGLRAVPGFLRGRVQHAVVYARAARLRAAAKGRVVHLLDGSYAYLLNLFPAGQTVVTCHDLIPLRQSLGLLGEKPSWPARRLIGRSKGGLIRAARIITESQAAKRDVCELAGGDANRMTVSPLPIDPFWQLPGDADRERHHLLHVGNAAFYKNREAVLRIFSTVARSWPGQLVMAGAAAEDRLTALADSLGIRDRVDFIAHPDDEALRDLYQTAKLFLFPSLIEGYGWPPLEAVACGCPVVASDVGAIREVLGDDGGCWFEAADEAGMAGACLDLLNDPPRTATMLSVARNALADVTLENLSRDLLAQYRELSTCI